MAKRCSAANGQPSQVRATLTRPIPRCLGEPSVIVEQKHTRLDEARTIHAAVMHFDRDARSRTPVSPLSERTERVGHRSSVQHGDGYIRKEDAAGVSLDIGVAVSQSHRSQGFGLTNRSPCGQADTERRTPPALLVFELCSLMDGYMPA